MYARTGVSEFSVKEAFYAQHQMVVDSCPKRECSIVPGNFNATTGTDRDGCESCVGPYGSVSSDESSSILLDLAKTQWLRIAGSWFQRRNSKFGDSWILVSEAKLEVWGWLDLGFRGRTCTAGIDISIAMVRSTT